jgi:two-component sensor histidine kinase
MASEQGQFESPGEVVQQFARLVQDLTTLAQRHPQVLAPAQPLVREAKETLAHILQVLRAEAAALAAPQQAAGLHDQIHTAPQRLQDELTAARHATEALRREMHHRIRNTLQLLSIYFDLQAETAHEPRVRAILTSSQQRLQALALIHDSIAQTEAGGRVDVAAYLQRLQQHLCAAYHPATAHITVRCHADAGWLEVRRATVCGLLLQELVSNCFKHAFPAGRGEIDITLHAQPDGLAVLMVHDTGVGCPSALSLQQMTSVGLQLVGVLAEVLEGTMTLEGADGTTVTVTFPVWPSEALGG